SPPWSRAPPTRRLLPGWLLAPLAQVSMQHMRLPHGTCAYALRSPLLPLWERQQEQKKKRRVMRSPGVPHNDSHSRRIVLLFDYPGVAAIEHRLQIPWAGALDSERFLLFHNTIIRGPFYRA